MSKIFSKRSGFTLVEIIVAFAIFAIMAAMLVSLTGLAVRQRQSNLEFSRELSEQQAYLASHERQTTYNSSDTTKFEFDFGGGINAELGYSVVRATDDETSEGGISYFVAHASSKPGSIVGGGDGGDEEGGASLALAEKVDSRIYGSKDFEYIQLSNINEVSDPAVQAAGNSMFTIDVYANDNDTAVKNKDSRLARNYKLRFDSKVIDCGYVGGSPSSPVYISYMNAIFGSDGKVTGGGNNQFEILISSDDTVRVSVPQSVVSSNYAETGDTALNKYCFPGMRSHFYVVLEGDVDLTADSFGKYAINEYGEFLFKPVTADITTTDKDGKESIETIEFINVYGAKPKAGVTILDPD